MTMVRRWGDAIQHRRDDVIPFLSHYFGGEDRRVLLIGAAGFDPRSCMIVETLAPILGERLHAVLVREERPEPDGEVRNRADENYGRLAQLVPSQRTVSVNAFALDGAPVLGRSVVDTLREFDLSDYTDIVVDVSALSIGASFPITAFAYGRAKRLPGMNVHLMVAANSAIDELIRPVASDIVSPVHGFKGRWKTDATANAAKLWMPQLALGQRTILERIRRELGPDDIAPILPFPARHPRVGDELIAYYGEELWDTWDVDARDLVYAEENNPLDLYRTILSIEDRRRPVFEETGGSLLVLSPVGSKVLAVGAMLAALERELPVLYAESVGYEVDFASIDRIGYVGTELVHVWLHGDVYSEGPLGRD